MYLSSGQLNGSLLELDSSWSKGYVISTTSAFQSGHFNQNFHGTAKFTRHLRDYPVVRVTVRVSFTHPSPHVKWAWPTIINVQLVQCLQLTILSCRVITEDARDGDFMIITWNRMGTNQRASWRNETEALEKKIMITWNHTKLKVTSAKDNLDLNWGT